jgi:hypothetical protein
VAERIRGSKTNVSNVSISCVAVNREFLPQISRWVFDSRPSTDWLRQLSVDSMHSLLVMPAVNNCEHAVYRRVATIANTLYIAEWQLRTRCILPRGNNCEHAVYRRVATADTLSIAKWQQLRARCIPPSSNNCEHACI